MVLSELQREPFHSDGPEFDATEGLEEAILSLEELTADPWFRSLWTLQEGYLQNHAIILSREGRVCCDAPKVTLTSLSLDYIFKRCSDIVSWSERTRVSRRNSRLVRRLDLAHRTGLGALWLNNPMGLLGVAHNRNPTHELDRVYGIMQVLGSDFRVGKAANPLCTDEYTREKLEEEFGKAILERYPVPSQMHAYLQAPPRGKGWRVQGGCVVPRMVERGDMFGWDSSNRLEINIQITAHTLRTLSTRMIEGFMWGRFSGLACPFKVLQQAWRETDDSEAAVKLRQSLFRMHGMTTQSTHMMALDRGTHLSPIPSHLDTVNVLNTHSHNRQHELAAWVAARAEDPALWISLLGKCTINDEEFTSGLLMFEKVEGGLWYWRRVGICVWLHSHATGDSDTTNLGQLLSAKSDHWRQMQLVFG